MTLANMRAQGVRPLWVVCDLCHHEAIMNVGRSGDDVPVAVAWDQTEIFWQRAWVSLLPSFSCVPTIAGS